MITSDEQNACVESDSNRLCIIASAGTGKTRTLVNRILRFLNEGMNPDEIVAFTFTNKAAEELRLRLETATYPQDISDMYVGTIHGFCRRFMKDLYPHITEFDEINEMALISRLWFQLKINDRFEGEKPHHKMQRFHNDLSIFFNESLKISDVTMIDAGVAAAIEQYIEYIESSDIMTYSTMIYRTRIELERQETKKKWKHVFVDEFQDTNRAQVELIKSMIGSECQLTVVGDNLQSIYNWRGGNVDFIDNFSSHFKGSTTMSIATNFRSRPKIVAVANGIAKQIHGGSGRPPLIAHRVDDGAEPAFWISVHHNEGDSLDNNYPTTTSQGMEIATICKQLCDNGSNPSDISILMRAYPASDNKWLKTVTSALYQLKVPFHVDVNVDGGGLIGPLEDILAYVIRISDPELEKMEAKGGPDFEIEVEKINELSNIIQNGLKFAGFSVTSDDLLEQLGTWSRNIKDPDDKNKEPYNIRNQLYNFMEGVGIKLGPDRVQDLRDLAILTQVMRSVEVVERRRLKGIMRRSPVLVLSSIYFTWKAIRGHYGSSEPIAPEKDEVTITTIHQSKGLAWPIVIIPNLVQGRFPSNGSPMKTRKPFSGSGGTTLEQYATNYGTSQMDELRLFYVATTRARERVFFLNPVQIDKQANRNPGKSKGANWLTSLEKEGLISQIDRRYKA